jgi:hypothetical protein
MMCALCRWRISRAEDTGRPLGRFAARHVRRCRRCGDYARSVASIASRLRAERPAWLAAAPEFEVDLQAGSAGIAPSPAAARAPRRSWLGLRPLPVAAAVLAVVAGALVLYQVVLREPAPTGEERTTALATLRTIAAAPAEVKSAIKKAESPLDRERRVLGESVASAVEYLQARLNIKIERREPPAKAS